MICFFFFYIFWLCLNILFCIDLASLSQILWDVYIFVEEFTLKRLSI